MGVRVKSGQRRGFAGGLAVGVAASVVIVGGVAAATIPATGTELITGCRTIKTGALRVIDNQAGKRCTTKERTLTWNARGPQGLRGLTGAVGAEGAIGSTGPVGIVGQAGTTGLAGAPGLAGTAGLVGATGLTGDIGPAGPVGTTGLTGAPGPAGMVGQAGTTGLAGAPGLAGTAGLVGATGLTGDIGPAGPVGTTGLTGAPGPFGMVGQAGPAGATGLTGATGATGPAGPSGVVKYIGPQTATVDIPPLAVKDLTMTCPLGSVPLSGSWTTLISTGLFSGTVRSGMVTVTGEVYSRENFTVTVLNNLLSEHLSLTGDLNCWQFTYR